MSQLAYYMQYSFVIYALIVGALIALCSSLMGVTLVLKRYSFIGDGLSHVAFGALAVASVLKLTHNTWLTMPVTLVAAILLLRAGTHAKIKGDAAIAMISVGALAVGYMLMSTGSGSENVSGDVCSTLFGSTSILTLTSAEVISCAIFSAIFIVLYILFYNKIFAVTFDEDFAKASGTKPERINLLIAILIAIIIVVGMSLVGSLLISALIIFPALAAMRLFFSFKMVIIASAIISLVSALVGMLISIMLQTPLGATIVIAQIVAFAICYVIGLLRTKRS
ncbi:metal ABC transporter permease [Eubacterium oxidoreducens]|uniref:Zinc transport system permease protein n=1 Tax=Eubacterium oxidoreducens TaxID=1732 RepID=A0A1G6CIW1_EUBOX|nr:metal ABC transporter permease [Eubacterium oxidoreducens]SDB32820.1 zinc transport system permease protein [Eubacterium oxidoreducens]